MKISIFVLWLSVFSLVGCRNQNLSQSSGGDQIPISVGGSDSSGTSGGVVMRLEAELGIPKFLDLRKYDSRVQSQFGGTCSAFATGAAMDNLVRQQGQEKEISERHLWSLYGRYDMDYAIEAASKNFITEEQYWPVVGSKQSNFMDYASVRIAQFTEHQYNWKNALRGLSKGHPLVMAIQTPSDLGNCKTNVSANSSRTSGEHVVAVVGYQLDDRTPGGGYFIIKNSWGEGCGSKGYHTYPFQLCERKDLYCYFTEVESVDIR